jgi:plastocyanin/mono/diheme cytochrome c family protein
MSKRPFFIFGIVALIAIVAIPYWAIKVRGDESASVKPIPASDKTAQTLFQENCGACHTLAAGGTDGVVGPNLDVRFGTGAQSKSVVDSTCVTVLSTIKNGLSGRMPAGILQGANAKLVSSFIARNVDYVNPTSELQPSNEVSASQVKCSTKPTGATTAKKPAKPKPSAPSAAGSTVNVAADPSGQLKYDQTSLTAAKAGKVTIDFTNQSPVQHDVTVADASGKVLGATQIITGSSTSASVNLKPGNYTFYCSVDSHEQAGMKGTLTVK